MRKFYLFLLLIVISINLSIAQSFLAGAAKRVITPDPLLPVSGGIGMPNPVSEQKGDLYARAFVMVKDSIKVAIVNVDNLGWPAQLGDRSRELIPGIPPENILIGATHTHSGPDAYGFPDETGKHHADLAYLDFCVQQIADAVNEALASAQPANLKIATGKAEGKIAFNYYAEDLYDPRCGIIQALSQDTDSVIATLLNYAIHPEVLGANRGLLSPDLCGPLYDRLEEKVGGTALFMNSALGGMVTADNRDEDGKSIGTWEECIRIGELLADEGLRIIADAPSLVDPELACFSTRVTFPVESQMMQAIMELSPLAYEGPDYSQIHTTMNLVNVGTAQILTIPGEALPNIGYYLKRKMTKAHPFLFGLTQDAFGYILTSEDYNSFGKYDYITRTSLGERTGEILIEEALKLIGNAE